MQSNIIEQFNIVYDNTYSRISKLVISKCDNISNIEDIVQDVYSELLDVLNKKGVEYILDYEKFTYNLAKKKIFKYYSLKNKIKDTINIKFTNDIENSNEFNELVDNVDYEDEYLEKYDYEIVLKEIKKMDLITQKVIILFYLEELKISEISNILEISTSNTKAKLYRGIEKLRSKLYKGGNIYDNN